MTASAIAVALVVIAALLIFSGIAVAAPADPEVVTEPYVANTPLSRIQPLAEAIAQAEGFYVSGSVPQRARNPGDLELGDQGLGTIGGKTIFASDEYGWQALYHQLQIIADGRSRYYNTSMTLTEFAQVYTGGDQASAWAQNVAGALGIDPNTTLGDVLNG